MSAKAPRKRGRPKKKFVLTQNGNQVEHTYESYGITRKQAWVYSQYAAIPDDVLDAYLDQDRLPSQGELLRIASRYTGAAADDTRIKISTEDPAKAAWQIASQCTPGFVGELVLFLMEYLERASAPVAEGAR